MPPRKKIRASKKIRVDDSIGDMRLIQATYKCLIALKRGMLELPADCLLRLMDKKKQMKENLQEIVNLSMIRLGDDDQETDNEGEEKAKLSSNAPDALSPWQYDTVISTVREYIKLEKQLSKNLSSQSNQSESDGSESDEDEESKRSKELSIPDFDDVWWNVFKAKLPREVLDRYKEVCFGTFSRKWYPAIEVGPLDVSGDLREAWFAKYDGKDIETFNTVES